MLTITRQKDQRIVITTAMGEEIVITVAAFNRLNSIRPEVRLGFIADRSIHISREEITSEGRRQIQLKDGSILA